LPLPAATIIVTYVATPPRDEPIFSRAHACRKENDAARLMPSAMLIHMQPDDPAIARKMLTQRFMMSEYWRANITMI